MVSIILLQSSLRFNEIIVSRNSVSPLSQVGKHLNIPRYWVKANRRNIIEDKHNSTPLCVHVEIIAVNFMTISQQRCNEFILPLALRWGGGGSHSNWQISHTCVQPLQKTKTPEKVCAVPSKSRPPPVCLWCPPAHTIRAAADDYYSSVRTW